MYLNVIIRNDFMIKTNQMPSYIRRKVGENGNV